MGEANRNLRLIVRAGAQVYALSLTDVVEVMRALPVRPLVEAPDFVRGLSLIRGCASPVVDFAKLLTNKGQTPSARFVSVRAGQRTVALAVDAVLGIRELAPTLLRDLPPLLQKARPDVVEAVGVLDAEFFLALRAGRLVPDTVWDLIREKAA